MSSFRLVTLVPLTEGTIRTGAARSEGRTASHDGEYFCVVANPASQDWLAENNSGLVASNLGDVFAMQGGDPELAEYDAEAEAISRQGATIPAGTYCDQRWGAEMGDALIAQGWAREATDND